MRCTTCSLPLGKLYSLLKKELLFCPRCGAPIGELDQLKKRLDQHQRNLWDLIQRRSATPFVAYLNRQIEEEEETIAHLKEAIARLELAKPLTEREQLEQMLLRKRKELADRRKDLNHVEERAAKYGMDVHIATLNEIEDARQDINRLIAGIGALEHKLGLKPSELKLV